MQYQKRKAIIYRTFRKAGRGLVILCSSRSLQSWFGGSFWIPVADLMKVKDRDWVLSSFSKKRMTPRLCSEASRNQVQNKTKEVVSHTVGICEIPWQRLLWMQTVSTGWGENENLLEDSSIEDCWIENWIRLSKSCEQKIEASTIYKRNITYTCPFSALIIHL